MSTTTSAPTVTAICWASQTGNAERLANTVKFTLAAAQHNADIFDFSQIQAEDLDHYDNIFIISSTYGNGDIPDNGQVFYKNLENKGTIFSGKKFSVCALGDKNYPNFCQAGKKFDEIFAEKGAQRIANRVDCDANYDESFSIWLKSVCMALNITYQKIDKEEKKKERKEHLIKLTAKKRLNPQGSKETMSYSFSCSDKDFEWECGDALAIKPENAAEEVDQLIQLINADGNMELENNKTLRDTLLQDLDIHRVTKKVREQLDLRREDVQDRDIIDILSQGDYFISVRTFIAALAPLAPRLYTYASAVEHNPDQCDIIVASVRYELHGRHRTGVASTFLADRCKTGQAITAYTHSAKHFRPADGVIDMVCIGPGTGIAPFRAFAQQRATRISNNESIGKMWLIFGDRNHEHDFYYENEWLNYLENGVLTRLDTAFSRDQTEKIYVQDVLKQQSSEVWSYLESGAIFYICGDAKNMAPSVKTTILDIIENEGKMNKAAAEEYFKVIKQEKRLRLDIY